MRLALFDLDHTLIPFDSGMAWIGFLADRQIVPPSAQADYLALCRRYVEGAVDIHALHRASLAPSATIDAAQFAQLADEFTASMAPLLPESMLSLVRRHRDAADLCALVTATSRPIAEPFARLFDLPQVLATEPALEGGRATGEIVGEPCHRDGKLRRVVAWLAARQSTLADFEASWFYSDAASDLPLLRAVSNPVAVAPDTVLRAEAGRRGWPILDRDAPG